MGCLSVQSSKDPGFSHHETYLHSGPLSILSLQLMGKEKKSGSLVGLEVAHVTSTPILW